MNSNAKPDPKLEEGHLVSFRMKLTVLSPVHIGSEQKGIHKELSDEGKIISSVREAHKTDDFINFLLNKSKPDHDDLKKWLIKNNINFPIKPKPYKENVKPFVKNINKEPYIPGSSIKGAVKTAYLFYKIRQQNHKFKSYYLKKIADVIRQAYNSGQADFKADKIIQELEDRLLGLIEIKETSNRNRDRILKDIFRGIGFSDSTPMKTSDLMKLRKLDLSTLLKKRNRQRPTDTNESLIPLIREYLKAGAVSYFTLTFDESLLGNANDLIDEILVALADFANYMQDLNKEKFGGIPGFIELPKSRNNLVPNLCLGGGAGFISKTLIHALAPDAYEASKLIAKYLDLNSTFKKHKHPKHDLTISPRTLKMAVPNEKLKNQKQLIGWCHIGMDE